MNKSLKEEIAEILFGYSIASIPEQVADQIIKLIKSRLPEKSNLQSVSEYYSGYNQAIDEILKSLE